jgi:drug/metabolite transporter (DMT)-like permease
MGALRLKLPRDRALTGALLYGALNFAAGFGLFFYALVELHAGFGQILFALVPLMTLLLAVAQRQERMRPAALVGILIALAGVALMSSDPLRDDVPVLSLLAALGSALCFAQAAIVVRGFPGVHPVTMNAVGMTFGAALLLVAALVAGDSIELPRRDETWAAIAYVVILGSVVVFLLYLYVLGRWAASRAAYVFLLIPPFTVALSAWLDDEAVGSDLVLGGLLVLAGVYVGALRSGDASPPVAARDRA